jgi:6-pyruvoyltetrahydropterin/6-carboxytetrahydropterin synthase
VTTLTRHYRFSASHILARPDWSAERNREIYGKCANPAGHGHDYGLEVTVRGKVDPASGMLIPVAQLDAVVRERVLAALDRRLLNRDVAAFEQDVPTAENIARFVWRTLAGAVSPAQLHRIRLVETSNNSVDYSEDGESR